MTTTEIEEPRTVPVALWRTPIALVLVAILFSLLPFLVPREGDTLFRLTEARRTDLILEVALPANSTAMVCVVLMLVLAGVSFRYSSLQRKTPLWLISAFVLALIAGFLAWAAAGAMLPVVTLLGGALALATPLIFGALGGVIGERSGVVNIALEAQLLAGAFTAAVVGSLTSSPWAGLIAAMGAGLLVGLVLSVFTITYYVNQVIVGVVLNVLVIGFTTFLYQTLLYSNVALLNTPPTFTTLRIPILSDIPVLGPVLFSQTIIVYAMYVIVLVVWYGLYRTRWGLRVRAVGEHPEAADTMGINVQRTRYRNMMLAGAITGIGGAFFTLVSVPAFGANMTAGAGFIALAAVIFGRWDPIRATLAALLFGFATNVQSVLSAVGAPVPSQFMLMLPYVVTIVVVAGVVGRSRPPAASGVPYIKS